MPDSAQLKEAIHTLTGILQRQQDQGKDGVLLSDEQFTMLKQLPQRLQQVATYKPSPASAPTGAPPSPVDNEPHSEIESLIPPGDNKREQLNHLARMVKMDENCRALGTLRQTMVFATGNPDGQMMLVGEAPGAEEELQRKPFVGPAGQLLDKILAAMGFTRENVYISNIVKFRPQVDGARESSSGNRKPNREEIDKCLKYIMAEIDIVQPKVIVALGGTAADGLLGGHTPVGKLRQQNHFLKGIPVVVTYHPSYLLHCESSSPGKVKSEKAKVWSDMKTAMEKLGLSLPS